MLTYTDGLLVDSFTKTHRYILTVTSLPLELQIKRVIDVGIAHHSVIILIYLYLKVPVHYHVEALVMKKEAKNTHFSNS